MRNNFKKLSLGLLLIITACSSQEFKDKVGLSRHSPDEFMILTNEPLQIPKNSVLPEPGTVNKVSSNRMSPQEQAMMALSDKKTVPQTKKISSDDKAFLADIGQGDKDINKKLESDIKKAPKSFITGAISVEVINPKEEAKRIKTVKEANEKLTGEDVQVIKIREAVSE